MDAETKRIDLFNLSNDRAEAGDVSEDSRGIVARMKADTLGWAASLPTLPDAACVSIGKPPAADGKSP